MFNLTKFDGDYPSCWTPAHVSTFVALKELCQRHNAYIAGGAARSLVNNELSNDFDIYMISEDHQSLWDMDQALSRLLGVATMKMGVPTYNSNGIEVQFISFKIGDPQEVISTFDFTCCQVATNGDWIVQSEDAIKDIHNKKLRWTKKALQEPVNLLSRFWRIQKYLKKGYTFAEGEADKYFKMEWAEEFKDIQTHSIRNLSSHADQRHGRSPMPTFSGGSLNDVFPVRGGDAPAPTSDGRGLVAGMGLSRSPNTQLTVTNWDTAF